MFDFIRKLAALALLLMIPLQDAAALSLLTLQCPPAEAGAAHAFNSDNDTAQERDDADKNISGHFFCHQLPSGIPVIPAAAAPSALSVFESSISLLSSLFFPEQPQRPPLLR